MGPMAWLIVVRGHPLTPAGVSGRGDGGDSGDGGATLLVTAGPADRGVTP